MAHIVVIGAGIGGLPAAYELRHLLPYSHRITLIAASAKFTFIPSLPWVALGLTPLSRVQIDLKKTLPRLGIELIIGEVTAIAPANQEIAIADTLIPYDFVIIATGAELALDAVPGLGPDRGYSHSVCNPHHAEIARQAWAKLLENPGPLVVGAVPGASCFGPVYEFAMLADFVLRRQGIRQQIPITVVTPEPYAGHLGIGGMANSAELVKNMLALREIELVENAAISQISPDSIVVENRSICRDAKFRVSKPEKSVFSEPITRDLNPTSQYNTETLADRRNLPFSYAMLLPSFRGPSFVRKAVGLGDEKGFLSVLPTGQHPKFDSIYAVGVVVQITPPEKTPIPIGVPKTGQMTEAMAMAAAHNIALKLGAISGEPVKPTLEAICLADFGETGIAFIASPVLPDRLTGKRRVAIALEGRWVSFSKLAFEKFFLTKMRWGLAVPWFEKLGLQLLGLSLVEPISEVSPHPAASQQM